MKMVREFVEQAESKGYQSMTKEAGKYAEEYGLQLQLNQYDKFTIRLRNRVNLKWYYDENHIFSIEAILRHKQVACMRKKMLFTIFKYLFLFQRYSSFKNMQISLVMTSYTQPSLDQI